MSAHTVPTSPLFVPASRPERVPKALRSGADAVIIDLEDAVAEAEKAAARSLAAQAVARAPREAVEVPRPLLSVRVNGPRTEHLAADLAALEPVLHDLDFVVLPMVSCPEDLSLAVSGLAAAEERAGRSTPLPVLPQVETARGVLGAREVAAGDARVLTLAFGPADLASELGVGAPPGADGFLVARSMLVLACAAAGVAPPLEGPHLNLDDAAGLAESTAAARSLGFGGRLVVHPRQVAAVRAGFAPSEEEVAWAREVDREFTGAEARGLAAVRLADGTFVDYPVARRARGLLSRAR